MAEELQGLLERIQQEGVKKADEEKDKIIADAKKQAEDIVAKAKEEAAAIKKEAEEAAAGNEARAKSAIQQAARDIVLALRSELEERLKNVVKDCIDKAMDEPTMSKILLEMAALYREKNPDTEPTLEVIVSRNDLEMMQKAFMANLLADLKEKPELTLGHDLSGGLKIGFKDNDVFFDFSDDAISDLICDYIGPKLAAHFKTEKPA